MDTIGGDDDFDDLDDYSDREDNEEIKDTIEVDMDDMVSI